MIICYLAGPIDYEADKGSSWKNKLLELCSNHRNIGFFDPCAPFKFSVADHDMSKYIHDINMCALENADILVGRLMRGQSSVGTPIEFYHVMDQKPMLIETDMKESVYMQYIGTKAIFVKDTNELYGNLIKLVSSMEDKQAQQREMIAECCKAL